jgi:hypothetical protein
VTIYEPQSTVTITAIIWHLTIAITDYNAISFMLDFSMINTYIHTTKMLADGLTKPLEVYAFKVFMKALLGIKKTE